MKWAHRAWRDLYVSSRTLKSVREGKSWSERSEWAAECCINCSQRNVKWWSIFHAKQIVMKQWFNVKHYILIREKLQITVKVNKYSHRTFFPPPLCISMVYFMAFLYCLTPPPPAPSTHPTHPLIIEKGGERVGTKTCPLKYLYK